MLPLSNTDIEVVRRYLSKASRFRQHEGLWEAALEMFVDDLEVERSSALHILGALVEEMATSRGQPVDVEMDRFGQWAGQVLSGGLP